MNSPLRYSVAVVIIVAFSIFSLIGNESKDEQAIFVVSITESKDILVERGVVKSSDASPVKAGASGTVIEIIEHGVMVKKGQQMFRMDNSEAVGWLEDGQERLESHKSEFRKIQNELSVVQVEERNRQLVNKSDLELAKIKLQLEEMGLSKRTLRMLEIDLALAKMNDQEKREELDRTKRLFAKGLASQSDIDKAERALIAAEARVEEQRINNELLKKGATFEELEEMRSQVALKEFHVAKGEQISQRKLRKIKNKLKVLEEKMNVERKDMTISGAQVDGAISYATRDGIAINKGFTDWRNAGRWMPNAVGTERWIGDVIFDIIDPRQMCVQILINDLDRPLVEEGQNVQVYIPALKNQRYSGRIAYIGGIGRDRLDAAPYRDDLGKTKVTVYNAVIEFDDLDDSLRPGMSALIHMPVSKTKQHVLVPLDYIIIKDDEYFVKTESDSGNIQKVLGEVKANNFLAVESGLSNGDRLLKP